jgi:transcriptional regulator with XRE-family HTH domain
VPLREELAARRTALGLSTRELAARTGLDHTTIIRLEKGERQPTLLTLLLLAKALGCDILIGPERAKTVELLDRLVL